MKKQVLLTLVALTGIASELPIKAASTASASTSGSGRSSSTTAIPSKEQEAQFYIEQSGLLSLRPAAIQTARFVLGGDENTPRAELIRNWRKLALKWHPDKAAPEDKALYTRVFKVINNAHMILGLDRGV